RSRPPLVGVAAESATTAHGTIRTAARVSLAGEPASFDIAHLFRQGRGWPSTPVGPGHTRPARHSTTERLLGNIGRGIGGQQEISGGSPNIWGTADGFDSRAFGEIRVGGPLPGAYIVGQSHTLQSRAGGVMIRRPTPVGLSLALCWLGLALPVTAA